MLEPREERKRSQQAFWKIAFIVDLLIVAAAVVWALVAISGIARLW